MLRLTIILVKGIGYRGLSLCDILPFSQYKSTKKSPFYQIFTRGAASRHKKYYMLNNIQLEA